VRPYYSTIATPIRSAAFSARPWRRGSADRPAPRLTHGLCGANFCSTRPAASKIAMLPSAVLAPTATTWLLRTFRGCRFATRTRRHASAVAVAVRDRFFFVERQWATRPGPPKKYPGPLRLHKVRSRPHVRSEERAICARLLRARRIRVLAPTPRSTPFGALQSLGTRSSESGPCVRSRRGSVARQRWDLVSTSPGCRGLRPRVRRCGACSRPMKHPYTFRDPLVCAAHAAQRHGDALAARLRCARTTGLRARPDRGRGGRP